MKKLVLFLVSVLGVSTVAAAQNVSIADIYGSYANGGFRCDSKVAKCRLEGWNAGVDINLDKNWAVTVDVSNYAGRQDIVDASRYYGQGWNTPNGSGWNTPNTPNPPNPPTSITNAQDRQKWTDNWTKEWREAWQQDREERWRKNDVSYFSIMSGPKYTFGISERIRPYVHALVGVQHVNPNPRITVENNFTMALGGGIDLAFNNKLVIRALQIDYVPVRRYSKYEGNYRISYILGIAYRIGSK